MSRNWLVTTQMRENLFCEDYLEKAYKSLPGCRYVCGQLEKAPTTDKLHIQWFVNFDKPQRHSCIKKFDNSVHTEKVKINNGAHDYCMKEETRVEGPWTYGIKPVQRNSKTDW